MDVKKFQFFLLGKISRRSIWSDLGGLPIWRIEGVLVTILVTDIKNYPSLSYLSK